MQIHETSLEESDPAAVERKNKMDEKVFSDVEIAKFFKSVSFENAVSVCVAALAAAVIMGKLRSGH